MNLYLAIVLSLASSNYSTRMKAERLLVDMPFLEPELRRHMDMTLEVKMRAEKILKIWEDREIESLTANAPIPGYWYYASIDEIKAPLTGKPLKSITVVVRVWSVEHRYAHVDYLQLNVGPQWTPLEWTKWKWKQVPDAHMDFFGKPKSTQ